MAKLRSVCRVTSFSVDALGDLVSISPLQRQCDRACRAQFTLLNEQGAKLDEQRLPHKENCRHPRWDEHVRLFYPDNETQGGTATAPVRMQISLWDNNNKTADKVRSPPH